MVDESLNPSAQFKNCTKCGFKWQTQADFLSDPTIDIIGYQVNFKHLELGLFLFNHKVCGTTMAFKAGIFSELYTGPIYQDRATDTKDCPDYCLNQAVLEPCVQKCECAYIREIIQIIRKIPKLEEENK